MNSFLAVGILHTTAMNFVVHVSLSTFVRLSLGYISKGEIACHGYANCQAYKKMPNWLPRCLSQIIDFLVAFFLKNF